jgi:hypothetical protein
MQAIALEAFKSVTAWVWPTMLHSLWIEERLRKSNQK